ncbi:MAG: hypothetical protein MJ252_05260 [archaeon]|nr:hypothetical protein [archaeon]
MHFSLNHSVPPEQLSGLNITVDGKKVEDTYMPKMARMMTFENQYAFVEINAKLDFSGNQAYVKNLVKIREMKVCFSKELKNLGKKPTCKPIITIKFKLKEDQIKSIYEGRGESDLGRALSNGELVYTINQFEDLDIKSQFENEHKFSQEKNSSSKDVFHSSDVDVSVNNFNVNKNAGSAEKEKKLGSPAASVINEDRQEADYLRAERKENPSVIQSGRGFAAAREGEDFFSFKKIKPGYDFRKIFLSQLNENLSKPLSQDPSLTESPFKLFRYGIKSNFNVNASYYVTKENSSRNYFAYDIEEQLPKVNSGLVENQEEYERYKSSTIGCFLDVFNSGIDGNMKPANLEDNKRVYTDIIFNYIRELKAKLSMLQNQRKFEFTKLALREEIITLNLMKALYLNTGIEYQVNDSEQIQKIKEIKNRKKLFTEWLIDSQKDIFNEKVNKFTDPKEKILFCLINGQIEYAIKVAQENHMTMLSLLLPQLNNQKKGMYFKNERGNQRGGNSIINKIYKILGKVNEVSIPQGQVPEDEEIIYENANWRNVLIQLILFFTKPETTLNEIFKIFLRIFESKKFQYPNLYQRATETDCKEDINLSLIRFYNYFTFFENDTQNQQRILLGNISKTESFICSKNSDHHVQFLVNLIIYNIIDKDHPIFYFSFKSFLKLLNIIIEENLGSPNLPAEAYCPKLFEMIWKLRIPQNLKRNMLEDLLFKSNPMKIDFNGFERCIDRVCIEKALGFYYKSILDYQKAQTHFENGNLFSEAAEMLSLIDLNMLLEERGNPIQETLGKFREYHEKEHSVTFNSEIAKLYEEYLICMEDDGNPSENIPGKVKRISELIGKVLELNCDDSFLKRIKNFMFDHLRRQLKEKCQLSWLKEDQKEKFLPVICNSVLDDPNINLDIKIREYEDSLETLLYQLDKKYSKKNQVNNMEVDS